MSSSHDDSVDEGRRRARAIVLPPQPPEGVQITNEAEIMAAWNLPDDHCELCHDPARKSMNSVVIGERLIDCCCQVVANFQKATGGRGAELI